MPGLRKWWSHLRSLIYRSRLEHDLDDELNDYLEREVEREILAGCSPPEARKRALASLGGVVRVKEDCREARGVQWIEDLLRDSRFACRTLGKAPAFTITVVAALAFCIGLNAAIFSIVDTVLFRPLPFPAQGRLVSVTEGVPALGYPSLPFSCPDYLFVTAQNRSFEATGVYRNDEYEVAGAGQPRRMEGARVSASLYGVLGIRPSAGRAFTQKEDDGSARVIVLNDGFARTVFGAPQRAVGRTLLLNRTPYEVIGVMPPSFSFPISGSRFNDRPAEFFVPVSWTSDDKVQTVSNFDYRMIARLRPGTTVEQARADLRALIERLVEGYPIRIKELIQHLPHFSLEAHVVPFREEFTGDMQRPLLLLMAAVGIVLLIGCADVANLMFSRMSARRREFLVRTALGAGFRRLLQQTLIEGLLLSIAGGAIGLCIAVWTLPLLIHLAPDTLPRAAEIGLNWRITAFVAAIAAAAPLTFCLAPLVHTMRTAATNPLRAEGRSTTRNRRERRIMSGTVVGQFSLAFVLLTSAGLLLHSLVNATDSDPGFGSEQVLSMRLALPAASYKTHEQVIGLFTRLIERIAVLPGVLQTGAISDLPMSSSSNVLLTAEGTRHTERADTLFCLGDALEALRVRLLEGRLLGPDDYVGKAHVAVISEGLANRLWPGQDPIGRRVKFGADDPMNDEPWMTVVGIVADVKATLTSKSPRRAVFTTPAGWVSAYNVVVRTSVRPLALAGTLRRQVNQLDPDLPAGNVETIEQALNDSLSAERFRTWLFSTFAVAAMLLAMLGIAGLLAYDAAQRSREFGLRAALGASRRDLLGMVLRDCLRMSGAGVALGLCLSLVTARLLSSFLYDTSPLDPVTYILVTVVLTLVAVGAAAFPALRVIQTDPVTALRLE